MTISMKSGLWRLMAASLLVGTMSTTVLSTRAEAAWHGGGGGWHGGGWRGGYGYRGGYGWHGGWGWGPGVVGGALLGLGVGAAVAGAYAVPPYYAPGYYAPPPPAYYAQPAYPGYYPGY
jgi:hypothetical protein